MSALDLLEALSLHGLHHVVVCPGSRSGPLALAAGGLAHQGDLKLITAIDERSAGFLALGIAMSTGTAAAVITTSGTAVANLLPAAVEADCSCQPLLFLTADRPDRLKNRGANQTVNQEDFLCSVCRWFIQGPGGGLPQYSSQQLAQMAEQAWLHAHHPAGPVHLNLPFEEPLHASAAEQHFIWLELSERRLALHATKQKSSALNADSPLNTKTTANVEAGSKSPNAKLLSLPQKFHLDPALPGVVVAGPWRGSSEHLPAFQNGLNQWLQLSGWPLLADPLAAVGHDQPGCIHSWELLLPDLAPSKPEGFQILRVGPMPASRRLEQWLLRLAGKQVLVTEFEQRSLDPLGLAEQFSEGMAQWWQRLMASPDRLFNSPEPPSQQNQSLLDDWRHLDAALDSRLDQQLPLAGAASEPSLARWLAKLLPQDLPVMLAASSPVRDWLSFGGSGAQQRRCFSARGASGLDGTLSMAMGLALASGPTVLISGDLALLHDSNGWLHSNPERPPLVVILIDNNGGGLFQQLPLETSPEQAFEALFAMPQQVDQLSLAKAHGIPSRQLACLEDLQEALDWALAQASPALLRVCTDRLSDAELRQQLRNLALKADS